MFNWLRQLMATTHNSNVKRNIKASEHPLIVYKLAIIMELINTLDRSPLYRPGQTFFDFDVKALDFRLIADNLSLVEFCLRIQNGIVLTPINVETLITTAPNFPERELNVCPQVVVNKIHDHCTAKFNWVIIDCGMDTTNREPDDYYWHTFHRRLNQLFEKAISALIAKETMVGVDIHRATTVELDYLIAQHEGHTPRIKAEKDLSQRHVKIDKQVVDNQKTFERMAVSFGCDPVKPVYKTEPVQYSPSTDWKDGGPLLDKYDLEITRMDDHFIEAYGYDDESRPGGGPTRLIACVRTILRTSHGEGKMEVPVSCALSRLDAGIWKLFHRSEHSSPVDFR